MRFASLGSGSRGNALLIESGATRILVDCGFSARELERRMAVLGVEAGALDAIVVTHEHGDHIAGVGVMARRYQLPVWLTAGTGAAGRLSDLPRVSRFSCHEPFAIGDCEIRPFPVPHDAREPAQFVFSDGARRLGLFTDSGCSTPHIEERLSDCDALVVECNHDPELLATGRYPPPLKARVGGGLGHLSNRQAAEVVRRVGHQRLQHLIAAHLSEENNRPHLAREALAAAAGCGPEWIGIADQAAGLGWRSID